MNRVFYLLNLLLSSQIKTALRENNLIFTRISQTRNNRAVVYRNGCFSNSSHLGNQKHKNIPHDMFPHSSSSLNFYSYHYHFTLFILFNFKDGDHSKIPFFFCTASNQANSLLKWKRVYYYWKDATFKEIFPRE